MMTHVSIATGMAVDRLTSTRKASRNGAKIYASAMTIGNSATHVTIAIFHGGGGAVGAGWSGSVNHVSSPVRVSEY